MHMCISGMEEFYSYKEKTLQKSVLSKLCMRLVLVLFKVFEKCTNFYFETEKIPSKF